MPAAASKNAWKRENRALDGIPDEKVSPTNLSCFQLVTTDFDIFSLQNTTTLLFMFLPDFNYLLKSQSSRFRKFFAAAVIYDAITCLEVSHHGLRNLVEFFGKISAYDEQKQNSL